MSRLTIGKRLVIGVTTSTLSLLVLSLISLRMIGMLGSSLDVAVNSTGKKLDLAGRTNEALREMKDTSQRQQIAFAIAELSRTSAAARQNCSTCHAPDSIDRSTREIQTSGAVILEYSGELRRLVSDAARRQSLDTVEKGISKWMDYSRDYLKLASSNQFELAHSVLTDKMFPVLMDVQKAAKLLAQKEGEALSASNQKAQSDIAAARWILFIVIGFNLLVSAIVLWIVFRIAATLRQTVVKITKGIEEVTSVAGQVSGSSQSLAQGASEQAASLEETSASTEEINSMAQRNSENSHQAAELVFNSQQRFRETDAALRELEAAMVNIDSSGTKISKIIKTIDEIAFQTNILALNAAVEAARAGEAGLGFAVVAEEVRSLAQRCAQAAKDTAGLIQESISNSQQGKLKVDRMAASIQIINQQAVTVKTLVDEVSLGSREQARGVDQVAKALTQMELVTQKTAATAEQNAAAGQELSAQSRTLQSLTEQLRVMVDG